ncbi:MAG: thioredoxin-dependent thiol peroxidase [Rhodoglobus sp.]
MSIRLEVGDIAPAFTLTDHDGNSVSLSDFRGQKVIVYFYPEALTVACEGQACDFRDNLNSFTSAGYQVLGISRDLPEKLLRATEKDSLNFPLLSDPDHAVHDAYGTFGEKNSYGRIVMGVLRSTFVIDENGVITLPLYSVKAKGHVAMMRKKLGLD